MGRTDLPASAALKTAKRLSLGRLWPVWGVLVACIWAAFSPVLVNGFVDWDDPWWILENDSVRGLGAAQIRFAFTTFTGGVYQPLGWLVQSLTYQVYGLEPRGYHLIALIFHVVNVLLLHLLCVRLMARRMPAAAERLGGALGWLCGVPVVLYAVHPLRVELVAWASCQAYLPSITFSLLATLAYLRAHPSSGEFRPSWMIASSILVVLAVLLKGSAVVLPFLFLILDAHLLGRLGPEHPFWPAVRKGGIEKGPMLVFCLTFTAVAIAAKSFRIEPEVTTQPVVLARVAQACFGACFYLMKTVWPFGITAFYPRPEHDDFQTPFFVVCIVAVALAVSTALWHRRRWPWLVAALAAYFVIASPYLGLVRVGIPLAADRYSYAPMMAWVVLGCAGLCRLAQRCGPRRVLFGAGAGATVITGGLMVLCSAQCHVWDSSEHLWAHALQYAGWSAELHNRVGASLVDDGKLERASAEFREALGLRPHDFDATRQLGIALDLRGETDSAIMYLREAKRLRPEDASVHLSLGGALVHQGGEHIDEAIALYHEGLELRPSFPNLHYNLGVALLRQRKVDEAIQELNAAVTLRPGYTEAYATLGAAFVIQGRLDEAVVQYEKALRLDPSHSAARINLGLTLARQGHYDEAIVQLREAIQRHRQDPEAHHVLGAILVTRGRMEEAAAEFEETLRLRPDHPQARTFLAMARRNRL